MSCIYEKGLIFLSRMFGNYEDKLLIKLAAQKNMKTFLEKTQEILRKAKAMSHDVLIRILNPVIRGRANYPRHVVYKAIFNRVDYTLWSLIWNWIRHCYPRKPPYWIKKKSFRRVEDCKWIFSGEKGERLYQSSSTPIQRHVRVKSASHSFASKWTECFETRKVRSKTKEGTNCSVTFLGQATHQDPCE